MSGQDIVRYRAGFPFSYKLSDRYANDIPININKDRISGDYTCLGTPPSYRFAVKLRVRTDGLQLPFSDRELN